jgi:hypothetical protein
MKPSRKNFVNSIVILVGMLLCYNICFQQSDSSTLKELSSEDVSNSDCFDADFELNEEDPIICSIEFSSMVENSTNIARPHFNSRSIRPHFPVWQPPKLS